MRGKAGAALGAIEKRSADLAFEIGDLFADGGLRDVEFGAGFAEGPEVGDGAEVT